MRNVTNEFKNSIKSLDVYSDGKIDIIDSVGTLSFDKKKIMKFEISGSSYMNEKILGNISTSTITVELLGDQTKLISRTKNKIIRASIGVMVNGAFEYVNFQDFIVIESKFNDTTNLTTLYGSDYTYKLNVKFVDTNTYPLSLKFYLLSVLSFCGIEYSGKYFLNENLIIESKPFSDDAYCHEIIGRIAELAMSFACVDITNKLKFENAFKTVANLGSTHGFLSQYTHAQLGLYTHYEITQLQIWYLVDSIIKRSYWSLKINEDIYKTFGVNTLTIKINQVEGENNSVSNVDHVIADGNIEVSITDNPFINSEVKRLSVINQMFEVVDGYKIKPFNIEYRGYPHLEINDVINITLMNESTLQTTIHEFYIMYNGGLRGKLASYSPSLTDTKYKNNKTLRDRINNAEIRVNKAEASIELNAITTNELTGRVQAAELKLEPAAFTVSVEQITANQYGATIDNIEQSFKFNIDGLEIASSENSFKVVINEQRIGFYDSGMETAYISNSEFNIARGRVAESLIIGVHKVEKFGIELTIFRFIGEN